MFSTAEQAGSLFAGSSNAGDMGDRGRSQGREDPLEEEMAAHSSILVWKIPWMEEPGGLQSMESQRVRRE